MKISGCQDFYVCWNVAKRFFMWYQNKFSLNQNKFLFSKIYLYDIKVYFYSINKNLFNKIYLMWYQNVFLFNQKQICIQEEIFLLYNFFSSN